ncbi:vitamin K epoxide reductase family protein [uncultured Thermanaerothrix sp.]|uniref:vitamin K epoxide reductase family protein n=1 Tax=uncultured Thermanaerothrix sp. TaxID=1195149 RepID=UPI0026049AB1|nr:vitamin K epoxide reductase family protein [uncultured Thermanaerothrix sp.]
MWRVRFSLWRGIRLLTLIGVGLGLVGTSVHSVYGQTAPTRTPKICHLCDEELPATTPSPASTSSAGHQARVRLVMFWMDGCPHCHEVLEHVLPPLQRQFGEALEIRLIEIATVEDVNYFYQVAEFYGIPREQAGVPFLILENHVLKGSSMIASNLPSLIEQTLAQGGCDWPVLPELPSQKVTQQATPSQVPRRDVESTLPTAEGFGLLYGVMVFNGMSLIYAMVRGVGAWVSKLRGSASSRSSGGQAYAVLLLALIGLIIALYLSVIEVSGREAWCGPVGNCNAVQTSAYARLWGVLPIAVLGVLGYAVLIGLWIWGHYGRGRFVHLAPVGIWGVALFGASFSLYLSYLEAVVIRAVCGWCLASAAVMSLILLLSVRGACQVFEAGATPNLS